jgi:hypothetical protein
MFSQTRPTTGSPKIYDSIFTYVWIDQKKGQKCPSKSIFVSLHNENGRSRIVEILRLTVSLQGNQSLVSVAFIFQNLIFFPVTFIRNAATKFESHQSSGSTFSGVVGRVCC